MKKIVISFVAVLFLFCAGNLYAQDVIRLGVAGAHSGDLASYGIPSSHAAKLVVDEINAKGGVLGKQVVIMQEDDVCRPEVGANVATKLVSNNVDLVLGHICSGSTEAALPIYKDAGIVAMAPSATKVELTKSGDYPNFFRTISPDDAQAKLQADFCIEQLKVKTAAVLHDKGAYGKALAEEVKQYLEEGNVKVVLMEGITPGAVDYSAVISKVNRSGAEVVIWGGYHPEAAKLVTGMKKRNMDVIFIGPDGVRDDTFIKVAGEYAEGVYATGPIDTTSYPLAIAAIERHREVYGSDPGAFYLNAYAAAIALLNAIEKAGSTDYDKIVHALRTEWVETPLGEISFDERGDAIGIGFAMYQVQNNAYAEVGK
ncbi:MAG: branched-chain amino acid ABC transporter substrate-binding protein [Syntrophales bacterium]|jgi:branched-chain amino acid transport system substrate-binding protein|nr:branched-chain amino acid ABC transporter substrate-binding protein [Syntrophales bacterium]MCK9528649.1 branched-chain amino acid ABC transporter substrate-binding protein [Syntrophales bacterium]MDX9922044.1 branched-chain amino acid ABC transporter substrate-binding protein [Syntrophales bacterium]